MTLIRWCETHEREWDSHYEGCEWGYQREKEGGEKSCELLIVSFYRMSDLSTPADLSDSDG